MRQDEEKLAAGDLWTDHDLVFTTAVGTGLDAANVRRYFRGYLQGRRHRGGLGAARAADQVSSAYCQPRACR